MHDSVQGKLSRGLGSLKRRLDVYQKSPSTGISAGRDAQCVEVSLKLKVDVGNSNGFYGDKPRPSHE
ncbi:hypothetical protein EYF80_041917 [Liparis tanakae]|uniref:Uncharacterized protein n=1 Tax=Liparis tanakae TaxID=230148 RepID=A0A4Z2G2S2_9TELE|nr:hypothetical protein EYF80_041917 [Liparis tanakae]